MKLSLLVTAKDPNGVDDFVRVNSTALAEVAELRLVVAGDGIGGQAALANHLKSSALGEICGVVHADTAFRPSAIETLKRVAWDGKVCGIVGALPGPSNRKPEEKIIWGKSAREETLVSTLDSCAVFFRKDLPFRFDEDIFDAWHCVVEDFCLNAARRGCLVVVPPLEAEHRGDSTFNPEWQAQYRKYRELLNWKWSGTEFATT